MKQVHFVSQACLCVSNFWARGVTPRTTLWHADVYTCLLSARNMYWQLNENCEVEQTARHYCHQSTERWFGDIV